MPQVGRTFESCLAPCKWIMLTACTYHTDMSKKRENLKILNPSIEAGFFMGVKYATQAIKHTHRHSIDTAKRQCGQMLKDWWWRVHVSILSRLVKSGADAWCDYQDNAWASDSMNERKQSLKQLWAFLLWLVSLLRKVKWWAVNHANKSEWRAMPSILYSQPARWLKLH